MIKTETSAGVTIFVIETQRLDASNATAFHSQLAPLIKEHDRIILDFTSVEFMDSTGIGALVGVTKGKSPDARIAMCGLTPAVETIFKLLRMDMFFLVAADRSDAIALLESA
ncbi:STAS domain-containing protein [Rhodovulum sulfidophilum]|uniref:STAS domain-containing protein n=1 Tax=Rhodovulum sulfidophilum TaxID=35806 RepID=UPI001920730C|nr:STAS domain-containing protein [Rhodovulum sulfidophilum]MBL3575553.1 STAS domain-containing protein [Rhodovulum sulfidophilum]MCE8433115.1 STAS domain-containing protein [Rhodovulum sulfidophilum]MCF4118614.1 STAS domain-containing protein [Rhodovulum sulfidophilum]